MMAPTTEAIMHPKHLVAVLSIAAPLAACSSGNVRAPDTYARVMPPPVSNPYYDPFPAYGTANATWLPPVYDRNGTIVKPSEPSTQASRPAYENAPWATGASGGSEVAPRGTF
jgi:hypothetical protein